jgi:hypothetical protein
MSFHTAESLLTAAPMPTHVIVRMLRLAAVPLLLLVGAAPAWSQVEQGFAKDGGFAGVSFVPDFTFDGVTFDGRTVYKEVGGEELMILPRVDARNLVRFVLGYRARQAAIEVSYDRTAHNGTFLDVTGKATFQAVNVDGRYFFATRRRIQPHLLFGGSLPWFTVKDGSFLDSRVADASFQGWGMNTEAGATVYVHRQLGISVGYNYRIVWFDRATGVSEKLYDLRPRFRETSGALVVATHLIF